MRSLHAALFVAATLTNPALAEEPDEIVVYGSRLGQTVASSGTSVTILTAEDLARQGYPFALDAIAQTPGVTVNRSGALGGAATVRVRGAGSDQTLVLIDGIPVGDTSAPGGGFDFSRVDASAIERIEIIRGPGSVLWGSEAIGGIVSITTRKPEGTSLTGFAEAGSFETVRGGISGSARSDKGGVRLAITGVTSDGISKADEDAGNTEDDGFRSSTIGLSGDTKVLGVTAALSVFYQEAETDTDSFSFSAPGGVADGDEETLTEELTTSLSLAFPEVRGVTQTLLAGHSTIDRDSFAGGNPAFGAEGQRTSLRYQATGAPSKRLRLAGGAEADLREAGGDDTAILSLFSLAEYSVSDALTFTAGLRRDEHEEFGGETTGRVALAYEAAPGLTLRANWGQGFRAPSLFQQTFFCCGAAGPNASLEPERSQGYEVGGRFVRGPFDIDLALFRLDTDDLIDFSFAGGAYINVAEATSEGAEVHAGVDILPWLRSEASYTYLQAEDGDGNRLARVPEHTGTFLLIADPKGPFSGTVSARYNGEETDNFGTVDAWTRLDISLRYELSDVVELYARGENLTDTDYQEVFGYGTPGRSGTAGIRVRY
ncbi:TonB-dependent receptor [Parvularcula sp. ZS-1/3]|uniref:TonB-dependent receptor n=1 Tax=Parvularcula mediterranea TaxID=2732508 RepID=A0A7Y3W3R7_9PROT|nr:TonB-dependent receptor [Parvularcula mediterranea]NNU14738.1 TonB-dependent receptor [Parvularcula mediterranea]